MAIVTFFSAKGAPGVTTTVVGLGLSWPRCLPGRSALVVDADPAGSATAPGILRGAVSPSAGMLPLATSRGVEPLDAVDAACVHLVGDGSVRLVPGVPDPERSAALALAWDVVVAASAGLEDAGVDVLVDAGRATPRDSAPWIDSADAVVLVLRPTLPAVTAAHRAVSAWNRQDGPADRPSLHLLIVDAPSPYGTREVAEALGVPLVGVLPFDPESARVHSDGAPPARGFERSAYRRGLEGLARRLAGPVVVSPEAGSTGPAVPIGPLQAPA